MPSSIEVPIPGNGISTATPIFLVSDRFKAQLSDADLISVSELFGLITWLRANRDSFTPMVILAGQGLDDESVADLCGLIAENRLDQHLIFDPNFVEPRAARELTHKCEHSNVLITTPLRTDEHSYRAWLRVDDKCDDIRDHLTGAHLSGMLLLEAARQMVLAVTEVFIACPADQRHRLSFITHSKAIDFIDFVFPLPVEINCVTDHLRRIGPVNFKASMMIQFMQNGRPCAKVKFVFSVLDQQTFADNELRRAKQAIKAALTSSPQILNSLVPCKARDL